MNQILTQYGVGNNNQTNAVGKGASSNQANMAQQQQLQQQLLQQQQLQVQAAALLAKNQQNLVNFGLNQTGAKTNGNQIVNSILQQQAQLMLNQQKLDEVKKMAKATKMAVKSSAKSSKSSSSSVSKGSLGTIGDLRSKYRSGTSSGFSSGSTDPSDSDGSSGISSSRYQNPYKTSGMQMNSIPVQHSSSNTSSGWSCDSGDDGIAHSGNAKFNFKLTEQRSGSKAAFLQKMVEVLESYFNDEGLKRNQFLMKQLQSCPDGIPLKKIASMRRVKVLTRDLLTVASAVRRSTLLELSRDGTLVKRVIKPACLEPPKPIQTVLAINLELENPTVESVTSLFSKYGELTQIRIIRPTSSLPQYLKEFTMWVPDLGVNTCAVIEFETQEQAQAACREINMINRADGKLRVALLKPGARIRRTLYRKYKDESDEQTKTTGNDVMTGKQMTQQKPAESKKKSVLSKNQKSQINLKIYNSKICDSGNGSDGSAEVSHSSEDEIKEKIKKPIQRRNWMTTSRYSLQVIRQPIGPDGSKGFSKQFRMKRSSE